MGDDDDAIEARPNDAHEEQDPLDQSVRMERMRTIVAQTPGAAVFEDGMKVPGQEEREEEEAEWMRGEFDPVGDLAVTGMRLVRGDGRSADDATGPQCGEYDDVFLTLHGTPVDGAPDPFFTPRGSEATLADRSETRWLVSLSNPKLDQYWVRSLRAMSRGDWCRFTCAAKRAQAWLQSLADCCEPAADSGVAPPPPSESRRDLAHESRRDLANESRRDLAMIQVPPSGRDVVVDVRLDSWLRCSQVGNQRDLPAMYKRVLRLPHAVLNEAKLSASARLREQLRFAAGAAWRTGRQKPSGGEDACGDEGCASAKVDAEVGADGRIKRYPRPPDRVRVSLFLRKQLPGFLWRQVAAAHGRRALEFSLGNGGLGTSCSGSSSSSSSKATGGAVGSSGGGGGGASAATPWAALEEAVSVMEEGEHATFRFAASEERLPLSSWLAGPLKDVTPGDVVELEVHLHQGMARVTIQRVVTNSRASSRELLPAALIVFSGVQATTADSWHATPRLLPFWHPLPPPVPVSASSPFGTL